MSTIALTFSVVLSLVRLFSFFLFQRSSLNFSAIHFTLEKKKMYLGIMYEIIWGADENCLFLCPARELNQNVNFKASVIRIISLGY